MELLTKTTLAGIAPNVAALIAAVPYCAFLGIRVRQEGERLVFEMPFDPKLIGNPVLPAIHGGVIGSLLETAAIVQTVWAVRAEKLPKPIDITIDYLRSGKPVASFAAASLQRQGRRVVNVHAAMWQEDEAKPVAALRGHFLLNG